MTEARRTHSFEMRNILALAATGNRLTLDHLCETLDGIASSQDVDTFVATYGSHLHRDCLKGLAQTLYVQQIREADVRHAALLYDIVSNCFGLASITGADRSFYADSLCSRGDLELCRELLSEDDLNLKRFQSQQFLLTNTRNPYVQGKSAVDSSRWLEECNAVLDAAGVAPIGLRPGNEAPFLRLKTEHNLPPVSDGPLVSILMPIFKPDESTDLAIASLLAQTYQNIEIIIVDDGSPETDEYGNPSDYRERLEKWGAVDSRVRISFNKPNRGAYTVRNIAYSQASGELVTVADKDDWHHPQRLELQVQDLLDRDVVANAAHWVRVDDNMLFLIRTAPDQVINVSFPSLMFRREMVKAKLGYWDEVRKGGDTEYARRLETVFMNGEVTKGFRMEPLLISLMGEGNLTAADNGLGYFSEARRHYRASYRPWHRAIRAGADSYLPQGELPRRISAPASFLPESPARSHFDFVLVGDFSEKPGRRADALRHELELLMGTGKALAIMPVQSYFVRPEEDTTEDIDQLILNGSISRVNFDTQASADVVVISDAALLQLRRDDGGFLEAGQVYVVADRVVRKPGKNGRFEVNYDPRAIDENVKTLFTNEPTWVARTDSVREQVLQFLQVPWRTENGLWEPLMQELVAHASMKEKMVLDLDPPSHD